MPSKPESGASLPEPAEPAAGAQPASAPSQHEAPPDITGRLLAERRQQRRAVRVRLLLIGLSAAGMAGAVLAWVLGDGLRAVQVLAGDVLLIFILLVAL